MTYKILKDAFLERSNHYPTTTTTTTFQFYEKKIFQNAEKNKTLIQEKNKIFLTDMGITLCI